MLITKRLTHIRVVLDYFSELLRAPAETLSEVTMRFKFDVDFLSIKIIYLMWWTYLFVELVILPTMMKLDNLQLWTDSRRLSKSRDYRYNNFSSSITSKPIDIRLIRTDSQPFWKIMSSVVLQTIFHKYWNKIIN